MVAFLFLFEATLLQQLRNFALPVLAPTDFLHLWTEVNIPTIPATDVVFSDVLISNTDKHVVG